jgi:hypothetical protein
VAGTKGTCATVFKTEMHATGLRISTKNEIVMSVRCTVTMAGRVPGAALAAQPGRPSRGPFGLSAVTRHKPHARRVVASGRIEAHYCAGVLIFLLID